MLEKFNLNPEELQSRLVNHEGDRAGLALERFPTITMPPSRSKAEAASLRRMATFPLGCNHKLATHESSEEHVDPGELFHNAAGVNYPWRQLP
jgi:hypothetical protein